jgi:hypothetical protein
MVFINEFMNREERGEFAAKAIKIRAIHGLLLKQPDGQLTARKMYFSFGDIRNERNPMISISFCVGITHPCL